MVFEQLFGARWLEERPGMAFMLGFVYAELGIISALLIFPKDPSLISIGFISILILPSLNRLLSNETKQAVAEKSFSIKRLFKNHYDILSIYAFLFLGILLAYGIFAVVLPAASTERLFQTQLDIYYSYSGKAAEMFEEPLAGLATRQAVQFQRILSNNFKVILVCMVFSLVYGAGSILFLTWNASVWGTIFGYVANRASYTANGLVNFIVIMAGVFPHMITEALSYFLAVFAGGIISKAVIHQKFDSAKFNRVIVDGMVIFGIALVVLVIAAWLEVYIYPLINI